MASPLPPNVTDYTDKDLIPDRPDGWLPNEKPDPFYTPDNSNGANNALAVQQAAALEKALEAQKQAQQLAEEQRKKVDQQMKNLQKALGEYADADWKITKRKDSEVVGPTAVGDKGGVTSMGAEVAAAVSGIGSILKGTGLLETVVEASRGFRSSSAAVQGVIDVLEGILPFLKANSGSGGSGGNVVDPNIPSARPGLEYAERELLKGREKNIQEAAKELNNAINKLEELERQKELANKNAKDAQDLLDQLLKEGTVKETGNEVIDEVAKNIIKKDAEEEPNFLDTGTMPKTEWDWTTAGQTNKVWTYTLTEKYTLPDAPDFYLAYIDIYESTFEDILEENE